MLYCDMSYNDIFQRNTLLVKSREFPSGGGVLASDCWCAYRLRVDGFKQRYRLRLDGSCGPLLAQGEGKTRGLVLHVSSPRPTQTVALGGYLFTATLARSWPQRKILQDDGAMIVVQTGKNEFVIGGSALTISINKDLDAGYGIVGIVSVEEGSRNGGQWKTSQRLNGDQSNQGRNISLPAHEFRLLRVRLYTNSRD